MPMKHKIIFSISLGCIILEGCAPKTNYLDATDKNAQISASKSNFYMQATEENATVSVSNQIHHADIAPVNSNNEATANWQDGFFKVVTDERSGQYAIADGSKSKVALKDKYGNVIWSVDVLRILGTSPISSIHVNGSNVVVKVWRNYVFINKETGNVDSFYKSGPD